MRYLLKQLINYHVENYIRICLAPEFTESRHFDQTIAERKYLAAVNTLRDFVKWL